MKTIGTRIRQAREARSIKQSVIAEALRMSQANYCKIENGETELKVSILERIAEFLQIETAALLAGTGHQVSTPIQVHLPDTVNTTHLTMVDRELFTLLLAVQGDAIHSRDALLSKQAQELTQYQQELTQLREENSYLRGNRQ